MCSFRALRGRSVAAVMCAAVVVFWSANAAAQGPEVLGLLQKTSSASAGLDVGLGPGALDGDGNPTTGFTLVFGISKTFSLK